MNPILLLLSEILLSLLTSIAVLVSISAPLKNILVDLCPTSKHADFWVYYTRIMLLLAPLLVVLIVGNTIPYNNPITSHDLLQGLKVASIANLSGLILGLIIVGKKVFLSISLKCDLEGQA